MLITYKPLMLGGQHKELSTVLVCVEQIYGSIGTITLSEMTVLFYTINTKSVKSSYETM